MLLWLAFRGQNLEQIAFDLKNANYFWVLASVIVSVFAHYIRALRWNMLIQPLGFKPSNSNTFHAVMIGYLANLAVPRMGEVSRCGVLNRSDKIPLNNLIGTVIVERIIDVIFMLSILALSILIQFKQIFGFINENIFKNLINKLPSSTFIIVFILIIIVTVITFYFLAKKYHQSFLRFTFYQKIWNVLLGFKDGIVSVIKMENKWKFIFFSILIWMFYIISTYLCYFAIEATSGLTFISAIFIMAIGGLGMAAPVQGGIGAFEASVQLGLLVYGIDASSGLSYATLSHSSQILSILVLGSISLIYIFAKYRKSTNVSER